MGRYAVIGKLGSGGMAEVLLARDRTAGVERLAVLKRLHPRVARNPTLAAMFLDEARICARLCHPHIAHLYELGEEGGTRFLAFEFVHGADLGEILAREAPRLSPLLAALVAARAASALHHAHQLTDTDGKPLHVVHRDVSPENIHVSHEGIVKVLDFGVAKAAGNLAVTAAGVRKGKLGYMSPEQLDGVPLDGRSDVFSLGVVLHEALTHQRLFKRASDEATIAAVLEAEVPVPSEIAGDGVPAALDQIVIRALERERDARFATAREMQEELELVLHEARVSEIALEAFMGSVYGDAALHRAQLLGAIRDNSVPEYLETVRLRGGPPELAVAVHERPAGPSAPTVRELPAVRRTRTRRGLPVLTPPPDSGPRAEDGAAGRPNPRSKPEEE
jgi:serine/threonine protein kinase